MIGVEGENVELVLSLTDELNAVNDELRAVKKRNLVLLHAFEKVERERLQMYSLIADMNRCADCAKYYECKQKKAEFGTFREKRTHPEIFCGEWVYTGQYTSSNAIMILARQSIEKGG